MWRDLSSRAIAHLRHFAAIIGSPACGGATGSAVTCCSLQVETATAARNTVNELTCSALQEQLYIRAFSGCFRNVSQFPALLCPHCTRLQFLCCIAFVLYVPLYCETLYSSIVQPKRSGGIRTRNNERTLSSRATFLVIESAAHCARRANHARRQCGQLAPCNSS